MSEKVSNEFKIASFVQKQKLPYEAKVKYAIMRAKEYYDIVTGEMGANVHVSVGGLDSITLLLFLRKYVDSNIKAVSVSSLEDKFMPLTKPRQNTKRHRQWAPESSIF